MKFYINLIILYLLLSASLYAQKSAGNDADLNFSPTVIPPSPDAAELGRYGLLPVGLFTGTAQAKIPLYTFKTKHLKVPIELNYATNGVKVDQIATSVGMGWSLSAGGIVSRSIHDDPDETANRCSDYDDIPSTNRDARMAWVKSAWNNGAIDLQPDIFTFNFMGYTGKFILNDDLTEAIIYPYQNLKIDFTIDSEPSITSFEITTPDGVKYLFGDGTDYIENAKMESLGNCSSKDPHMYANNSWLLKKITHPTGESIDFEYDRNYMYYYTGINQVLTTPTIFPAPSTSNCDCASHYERENICTNFIMQFVCILTKISSPGYGYVSFESDNQRTDLTGCKFKKISVYNEEELLKYFEFDYVFSDNNKYSNSIVPGSPQTLKHRMFLTELKQFDKKDKFIGSYNMEYNDINGLPQRLSFSQDHHGYFNGASNSDFVPDIESHGIQRQYFETRGGNRMPNSTYAIKGVLEKLIYPTGGYSQIVYEPATKRELVTVYPPSQSFYIQVIKPEGSLYKSEEKIYEPTWNQSVNATFYVQEDPGCGNHANKTDAQLNITNLTTGTPVLNKRIAIPDTPSENPEENIDRDMVVSVPLKFTKGHRYKIRITAGSKNCEATSRISFSYTGKPYQEYQDVEVGGLRVDKMIAFDGKETQEKIYYYAKYDDLEETSEVVFLPRPVYSSTKHTRLLCSVATPGGSGSGFKFLDCDYYNLKSSSIFNLNDQASQNIFYKYVTISHGEDFKNGGEEYKYNISIDEQAGSIMGNIIEGTPYSNRSWNNGQELAYRLFKKDEKNKLVTLLYRENSYKTDNRKESVTKGFVVRQVYAPKTNTYEEFEQSYDLMFYNIFAKWNYIDTLIETKYDENGENPVTVAKNYFYDNEQHGFLNRVETEYDDGNSLQTYTYYPQDYETSEVSVTGLIDKYLVGLPIDQRTYKNNKLTSGKLTKYNSIGQPEEFYLAESELGSVHTFDPVNPYSYGVKKAEFNYDINNNLITFTKSDNYSTSYIWAYKNTYPIAKIENATYSEINSILSTQDIQGINNSNDFNYINNKIDLLRNATSFGKSLITAYDYKPLVGIVKQIDPNGNKTYYNYDDFGRLATIKDNKSNIVKQYTYHYKSKLYLNNARAWCELDGQTGRRKVFLEVKVENRNTFGTFCNLYCNIEGEESKEISEAVGPESNHTVLVDWDFPPGAQEIKIINVSGSVEDELSVTLPTCYPDIAWSAGNAGAVDGQNGKDIAFTISFNNTGCAQDIKNYSVQVQSKPTVNGTFSNNPSYIYNGPGSATAIANSITTVSETIETNNHSQNGVFRVKYTVDGESKYSNEFVIGYVKGTIVGWTQPNCSSPCDEVYSYPICSPPGATCDPVPPKLEYCGEQITGTGPDGCPHGTRVSGTNTYCKIGSGFIGKSNGSSWVRDEILVKTAKSNISWVIKTGCFTYHWKTTSWSPECKGCDNTTVQTRSITCWDNYGNQVNDSKCPGTKPASSQVCNPRIGRWIVVQDWGTCVEVGKKNFQFREVRCSTGCCTDPKPCTKRDCETHECIRH